MANEKRLIDANALVDLVLNHPRPYRRDFYAMINNAPTVDAVEVVHGYTLIADEPKKVLLDRKCSICDQLMLATDNFCPMCGAKNEGEKIDGLMFADMEEIIYA